MHQLQRCRGNIVRNHTLKVLVALRHATRTRLHVCGFEIAGLDLAYGPQTARNTDHVASDPQTKSKTFPWFWELFHKLGAEQCLRRKQKEGAQLKSFQNKKLFMKIRQGTLYIPNWEKHFPFSGSHVVQRCSFDRSQRHATSKSASLVSNWFNIISSTDLRLIWNPQTRFLPLGTGRTLQTWRRLSTVSPDDIELLNYPTRSILIYLWQLDCAFNLQYKKSYFLETWVQALFMNSSTSGARSLKSWLTCLSMETSVAAVRRSPCVHASRSYSGKIFFFLASTFQGRQMQGRDTMISWPKLSKEIWKSNFRQYGQMEKQRWEGSEKRKK